MIDGDLKIELCGEEMWLLPERAMYWAGRATLFIADPHWGKAASFRAHGVPVPSGTTSEGVARMDSILERMTPRRIVFLGDFLHARAGRSPEMLDALDVWRKRNSGIELLLVRGNHDRHAGDPPGGMGIECVDAPHLIFPFVFAHHPGSSPDGHMIAGHLHPGVRLYGAGGLRERLPCFVIGPDTTILPAFGDFTGLADAEPDSGARVFAVTPDRIIEIVASPLHHPFFSRPEC